MEEPEEISDPRGESLNDQISDKIHGAVSSSSSNSESEVKELTPRPTPSLPHQQPSVVKGSINRVFPREKPPEPEPEDDRLADLFLWKDKKESAIVLGVVTLVWALFELLDYHLLTLICHMIILGLGLLFLWSNSSTLINKKPPHIPEVRLPEDPFVQVGQAFHQIINDSLMELREIAAARDLQKFLKVVGVMWVLSIIGSFCSFLTLFYIVFVFMCTIPVFYETYSDKIEAFAETAITEIHKQYSVFDSNVLRRIPRIPLHKQKNE